jgi:hypothetical protein
LTPRQVIVALPQYGAATGCRVKTAVPLTVVDDVNAPLTLYE